MQGTAGDTGWQARRLVPAAAGRWPVDVLSLKQPL